tara:strand:- start:2445 stop:2672 length:228 start_codon:yes stop_codon:yes gene_type:complete
MKINDAVDTGLKELKYRFLEKIREKVHQDEPLSASDINAVYAVLKDANLGFTPEDVMPIEKAMDFKDLPFPLPED